MPRILGAERQGEPPDGKQAVAALGGRGSLRCPSNDAGAVHELVPEALGIRHEQPKQGVLRAELEAKGPMQVGVALQVTAQHDASPGQGWAI